MEIQNLHPLQWVSSVEERYFDCCCQQLCDCRCVISQLLYLYWELFTKGGALANQRENFPSSQHGGQQGLSTFARLSTKSKACFFTLIQRAACKGRKQKHFFPSKKHDRTQHDRHESTCMIEDPLLHTLLEKMMRDV